VKLIAEPWDCGPGGYQVGGFPPGWGEWNDKFRDTVRDYWRSEASPATLAPRLCASADMFNHRGRKPWSSVNFITAHDGFTLNDLVSYNEKHNEANGENNNDGSSHNRSWNCGAEGPTDDPAINALRDRQMYVDLWPDSKDTEAVFLSMAGLYEKSGQTSKALSHLEDYEKQYGRDPDKMLAAELRILRIYEKAGSGKNVQRILGRVLDYYDKMPKAQRARLGPEATEAVARAAYAALEPDYESFAKISFPADPKKMQALVETKKKAMVDLRKRYSDIVNMKVAEPAICSLEKIGMLFKNFADRLAETPTPEMPIPAQLNPIKHLLGKPWAKWPKEYRDAIPEADFENIKSQLAQLQTEFESEYRRQLFEGIAPAEDSAAEAFATAVDTARNLAIYNDCSQQAYELLSTKYRPVKYPKVTEQLAELKATAESREGNGLLPKVQPVPAEQPKSGNTAIGAPDLSKVAGQGSAPAASENVRAQPAKGGSEPAKPATSSEPGEPDEPDLIP
jgi:hypothetical protein